MAAFHVYVDGPVERTPDGIQRLAVAISKKYGLPVPDLIKRMTAGRFRVKANIDAATADAYARALEEVGARVKVEEAFPTVPTGKIERLEPPEPAPPSKSGPIPTAARTAPPATEQPRAKAPTLPGEKPSRGGYYSVSPPPSAARTAQPTSLPRSKSPSSGPPREAHEKSQLMPPRAAAPPVPPPARDEIELAPSRQTGSSGPLPKPGRSSAPSVAPVMMDEIELEPSRQTGSPAPKAARASSSSLPPANTRPGSSSLPPAPTPPIELPPPRSNPSSLPPATTSRPAASVLPPATTPRPASSSLPPANDRSGSSSLPPPNTPRAQNPAFQSGLSAAYSQEIPVATDLGAIGNDSWSLSSLDGNDASSGSDSSFSPPSPGMPASIGPAHEPPAAKFAPKPAAPPVAAGTRPATPAPLDLFRPPDAEEAEQQVDLAVDTTVRPPRAKRPTTPPLGRPIPKKPSQANVMGGTAAAEMPRSRFAAGILLAIILGFIPAHFIASMREGSAFTKIDAQITATQSAADTPEMYAALDPFREAQLARKESERRSIALQSMLIWAVVAAGLGYVWFQRIPWDRMPRA